MFHPYAKASTNGAKYIYKVAAYKTVGDVTYTSTYSVTKTIYRLTTPTISSATNSGAGEVTVKWDTNSAASGYEVKYTVDSTTNTVNVSGANTVSKVLNGLTVGNTYKVYVRSYKTVGDNTYYSGYSAAKSVKVVK